MSSALGGAACSSGSTGSPSELRILSITERPVSGFAQASAGAVAQLEEEGSSEDGRDPVSPYFFRK